jgi:E1A-binding protein p400
MNWLAKEFARERKEKIRNASKYANAVKRSNLDLESRVFVRAQEEEKANKKRAAWIAKEVAGFWSKAQRVVLYKVRTKVEAKKKEVMDRQLDVLLGQTQRYSAILAHRLADEQPGEDGNKEQQQRSLLPPVSEEDNTKEIALAGTAPIAAAGRPVAGQRRAAAVHAAIHVSASATVSEASAIGHDEDEYKSGEDSADDEATLEEEEVLAKQEGRNADKEQAEEAAALAAEADLPLEELLARYGGYRPGMVGMEEGGGEGGEVVPSNEEEDGSAGTKTATLMDDNDNGEGGKPGPSKPAVVPINIDEEEEEEIFDDDGEESDNYRSGEESDDDDEATLEEEEIMAQKEGKDMEKEQVEEAAALENEVDVPLEQLLPPEMLARYGLAPRRADDKQEVVIKQEGGGEIEANAADNDEQDKSANELTFAAKEMAELQPIGHTLATATTTRVTEPPFLLKGQLREYQQIGLDWLVTLYHKRLNGILADEMGLGKTIQTIALLAHLACEHGDWGPHLVVVPTSVMLNWEMEFKKWCPAFKLLTYYGGLKERAAKRQGWSKPNAFHVCITSYTLVLQDARVFKRKKWKYLILDEAHMIKNWRSQRWQTLLGFNSKRRLLITGTPLQNDVMELWSLMHFLMPQVFASHAQFKDWFSNPLTGMVEGSAEYNKAVVERLHAVLRPFLLRRLKKDVEKQLPPKHEHVVYCRLSKRQRRLYEEYMASGDTRATLESGNFLGIVNCLMQLRKVCNHPDLFEARPIVSAFDMPRLEIKMPSKTVGMLERGRRINEESKKLEIIRNAGLLVTENEHLGCWEAEEMSRLGLSLTHFVQPATQPQEDLQLLMRGPGSNVALLAALPFSPSNTAAEAVMSNLQDLAIKRRVWRTERTAALGRVSCIRTSARPVYGADLREAVRVEDPVIQVHTIASRKRPLGLFTDEEDSDSGSITAVNPSSAITPGSMLLDVVKLPEQRAQASQSDIESFCFVIPNARAAPPEIICSHPDASLVASSATTAQELTQQYLSRSELLHVPRLRTQLFFPDRRLLQYDCGKLQELAVLLHRLKAGGHRALIFTQMSKMLDVLESFLNLHGHTYVRLDGATKAETRQILMQRFNTDPKIFCFILSTRSGGVGMNLIGADSVIFYDSDWNPAMDAQAQDRCHRIGQTREVHIYRLVSQHTVEENILKKSDQKRYLDFLAIQSGGFTTDVLSKFDPKALLGLPSAADGGGGDGAAKQGGPVIEDITPVVAPITTTTAASAAPTAAGGGDQPTAAQIRAAMRAAEDEGDAAAADALEEEVAHEMDEFTKDPPQGAAAAAAVEPQNGGGSGTAQGGEEEKEQKEEVDGGDDEDEGKAGPSKPHQDKEETLPIAAAAQEDEMMMDVAALTGGADGADALEQLNNALRPIERYAVQLLESEQPEVDPDALAAQVEATYAVEEFDIDAIEAQEEEREADIDEDEEANIVADWDRQAATNAYKEQVEIAQKEEDARQKAYEAWLAHYGLVIQQPGGGGAVGGGGGGGGGGGTIAAGGAATQQNYEDTAVSPRLDREPKKRRIDYASIPAPWETQEDLVLCSVVGLLYERGQPPADDGVYVTAAEVLGAGAAATSLMGVDSAARQGQRRNAAACRLRYRQLCAAYNMEQQLYKSQLDALKENVGRFVGLESSKQAMTAVYNQLRATASGGDDDVSSRLLKLLDDLRKQKEEQQKTVGNGPQQEQGMLIDSINASQQLTAAVRARCGAGGARVISSRLVMIIESVCQTGNAGEARQALMEGTFGRPGSGAKM